MVAEPYHLDYRRAAGAAPVREPADACASRRAPSAPAAPRRAVDWDSERDARNMQQLRARRWHGCADEEDAAKVGPAAPRRAPRSLAEPGMKSPSALAPLQSPRPASLARRLRDAAAASATTDPAVFSTS
jgi:hypothetical protein